MKPERMSDDYSAYKKFFFTKECDDLWTNAKWEELPTIEEIDSALFGYWYCEVKK